MSGAAGFGVQRSSGSSQSSGESGVSGPDRATAAAGGLQTLAGLEPIIESFMQNPAMLQLQNGLTPGASNLAGQLVSDQAKQFFSKLSGTGALGGKVHPANTSAIIGSATQRAVNAALPQFIDQARLNEVFNVTNPQNTQAQGINFLQQLASLYTGLTQGSSQQSSGSQKAMGLQMQASGGVAKGG